MADVFKLLGETTVTPRPRIRYKDMGDGTYAEVISTSDSGSSSILLLPAGVNKSGTITAGGTAQVLSALNASRKSLTGQNISDGDLWINEIGGTAVANTAGSYLITPGKTFTVATNRAISVVGATTGQAFTATET